MKENQKEELKANQQKIGELEATLARTKAQLAISQGESNLLTVENAELARRSSELNLIRINAAAPAYSRSATMVTQAVCNFSTAQDEVQFGTDNINILVTQLRPVDQTSSKHNLFKGIYNNNTIVFFKSPAAAPTRKVAINNITNESSILQLLSTQHPSSQPHQHIPHYIGIHTHKIPLSIVTLYSHQIPFSQDKIIDPIHPQQLVATLQHLKDKCIIHNNITSDNIRINQVNHNIILHGFSNATTYASRQKRNFLSSSSSDTCLHLPPNVANGTQLPDYNSDRYSLIYLARNYSNCN